MIRIFSIAVPARVFVLFLVELAMLFACYIAAAWADPDVVDLTAFLQYDAGFLRIAILAGFVIAGLFFRDLYSDLRIRNNLELLQNLCLVFGVAFLGQGLISYIDRDLIIPRKVMLTGSLFAVALLFCERLLFDNVARRVVPSRRVLFLGLSPTTRLLASHFGLHPESGMRAIGYIDTGEDPVPLRDIECLGDADHLHEIIEHSEPDLIVISRRDSIRPGWIEDFLALHFGGLQVEQASTLYERVLARTCVTEIWPSRLIFAEAFEPRSFSVTLQSLYSVAFAAVGLIVASPFMLIAALLIRLSGSGPVLERDQRIGLHDRPFYMYSFRCPMKNQVCTWLGRVLRATFLFATPRLFNVLAGHMVLVGPRPHRPGWIPRLEEEIPFYGYRHKVRPGLTGWATVRAPSSPDTVFELEHDLYYVENLSPMFDSLILLFTFRSLWLDPESSAG